MSFLDGINFGSDQVYSGPNLDLTYDLEEYGNDSYKPGLYLLARDEIPNLHATKYTDIDTTTLSEKSIVGKRQDIAPTPPDVVTRKNNAKDSFSMPSSITITTDDLLLLLVFLVLLVIATQIHITNTINKMKYKIKALIVHNNNNK